MKTFLCKIRWPSLFTAAILLPLLPLFSGHEIFLGDWVYHLWPIGFMGEYFKIHHELPILVNSKEMIFLPAQIFYGHLFYPLLGFFSRWIGPDTTLRIAILLLFTLQFFLVLHLIYFFTKNRGFSFFVACLVQWAIYPLTNLYNRSALTELFATLWLTCCLCCWLLMIFKEKRKEKIFFGLLAGWCLALSFGSHPITALFGSFFLLVAGLSLIPVIYKMKNKERKLVVLLIGFALLLTCLLNLPWIYLNHLMLQKIFISTQGIGIFFYGANIDSWQVRFSPYPHDLRVLGSNMSGVPNPYLDAQINMPLLIFLTLFSVLIFFRALKKKNLSFKKSFSLLTAGIFLFILSSWMSLSLGAYNHLPPFAEIIQFTYRMITYQNLALLLILVALIFSSSSLFKFEENKIYKMTVMTVCFILAFGGILIKNSHGNAVKASALATDLDFSGRDPTTFLKMPAGYNTSSYISTDIPPLHLLPNQTGHFVKFDVGTGESFGQPQPLDFDILKAQWVTTNVSAFSWNTLTNNNEKINRLYNLERFLSFWAEPGHYHLQTHFEPNPRWLFLRKISLPLAGVISLIPLIALFI